MEILDQLGIQAGGAEIYGYSIYQRMTNQELEEVQKTYHTDLSDVHELTVSVQENPLIISGKETEFDVLSSNGPFTFKPAREGSCEITSQGNHVKVKLLSNGVYLTCYDRLRHCEVVISLPTRNWNPKVRTSTTSHTRKSPSIRKRNSLRPMVTKSPTTSAAWKSPRARNTPEVS